MISILNYVLLGILIYVAGIPILEELATIIVQGLEVVKGYLVLTVTKLQEKVDTTTKVEGPTSTRAIGFIIPDDEEYEEDYNEDD